MNQALIFIIATVTLAGISRASLLAPRSHGFARFFAWEAILGLVVLNAPAWFRDPFAPRQLVSWVFLAVSIALVVPGVHLLRSAGRPGPGRADATLLGIEKTSRLVTHGIYGYIRHPLYASLLFLAWGAFLKQLSWLSLLLACSASLFLFITARRDELECIQYFGPDYQTYMERTKRFVPFVF